MTDIWFGTAGPRDAKTILVGEAWGKEESACQQPFVGQSGRELFRMLGQAFKINPQLLDSALSQRKMSDWIYLRNKWLQEASILLANVIPARPEDNKMHHFLFPNPRKKAERDRHYLGLYPQPILHQAIQNLYSLIDFVKPKLIIAAGNWPFHILSENANTATEKGYKLPVGIGTWRGSQTYSRKISNATYPLLPIIHPAAILRDWSMRHVTVHDLRARGARFLSGNLAWESPSLNSIFTPTYAQVRSILTQWYDTCLRQELWLSVDLETYAKRYITCIGFADSVSELCVPFFYFNSSQRHVAYWKSEEEVEIWLMIKKLLEHPNCKIIGQNFIYDTQYLFRGYCIDAIVSGETMVAHHVLFPGTSKGLAMLASLYNNSYCYWKDESEEWAADALSAQDLWRYNCKDTRATYEAWFILKSLLDHQGMWERYCERLEAWETARDMTLYGTAYNNSLRNDYITQLSPQIAKIEEWLLNAVPEPFRRTAAGKPWFTSSQLTMYILYSVLGLTPVLHKKTKKPTSDDDAINELCERPDASWLSPLLERLSELRSAYVFYRNFLSVKLDPSGRLATQFNISTPETFRWSSAENAFAEGGNLQNLPKLED